MRAARRDFDLDARLLEGERCALRAGGDSVGVLDLRLVRSRDRERDRRVRSRERLRSAALRALERLRFSVRRLPDRLLVGLRGMA